MTSIISPLLRAISNFNVVSRSLSIFRSSAPAFNSLGLKSNDTFTPFLSPQLPILSQVCGFKVKLKLRKRCKDCYFVIREQRAYVICHTHPRHKQKSMVKKPRYTWILTHASQSKVRPW
ncbi:large ribosomal subunit protein bL36m [Halyomorpha halys]|uniref:large ribosomal subunit protein bL36m n=1 Tax=Halyomorpha halys TaxID=286706 RepID=UPI000D0C831C|nr:39S ribosomal protein L36, mitochondrial [Halyomorpha halys]